jgi:glycosyltransferase involved in cell wall biosynthesis
MKTKQKILLFIDWYLPAVKAGGPVRSIANMVDLIGDAVDICIVCGDRDLGDDTPFANQTLNNWVRVGKAKVMYVSKKHQTLQGYSTIINIEKPTIIYINGLFSFYFSLLPLWALKIFTLDKLIIAPRGMLGSGALQQKLMKKKTLLWLLKARKVYAQAQWHATSIEEKNEVIQHIGAQSNVSVVSNITVAPSKVKFSVKPQNQLRLLFISRISIKKNLAFAVSLVQELISNGHNVSLDIYGPIEDVEYWDKIQKKITNNIRIKYKGILQPHEFKTTFNNYDALLFTTLHENYGHVIAEALSYGLPVVLSDQTPWRNLAQAKAGFDIALNDRTTYLASLQELLAMDSAMFNQWQLGAQQLFKSTMDTTILKQEYLQLFNA